MGTLVGRDAELTRCRAVFDSAAKGRCVRAVRIVGPSGVGKTALARELLAGVGEAGWLVVDAPSFRIHTGLPLFAGRRVLQSLLEGLGDDSGRYESGLPLDRERPEDFEEAFLRLFEGVTLDHRVLLWVDDAQWADRQSRALIAHTLTTLADRGMVLLSAERSDEIDEPAFTLVDEAIALSSLSRQASISVVRSIYPEVSPDVASTIAAATRGHPMDLVAVATAARENGATTVQEVSESARRVVAHDIALLDSPVRTFLQTCALIEDPIAIGLLQQLYPREQLLEMISRVSGRYLVSQPDGLRFVHAAIMEGVRETIPIEIPLRYRIIESIKKLPNPQLEDYERLAAHSRAVGDRELERDTLLRLADLAAPLAMTSLAIDATERALTIRPPEPEQIIPVYARLSQLYNMIGRELDCIRACQRALAEAESAGITTGLGAIVGSLILAKWHAGLPEDALAELHRHEGVFTEPPDRAQLLSCGLYLAMNRADEAEFARLAAALLQAGGPGSPVTTVRYEVTRALFELRRGNEPAATEAMRNADRAIESIPHMIATSRNAHTMHAFFYNGVPAAERELARFEIGGHEPTFLWIKPQLLIARSALNDACEFVLDRLGTVRDPLLRRTLLGSLGTAMVLRNAPPGDTAWSAITEEGAALESDLRTSTVWPIAAAWSVALSFTSPKRAKVLLGRLISELQRAPDFVVTRYPFVLVMTARNLDDRPALDLLAQRRNMWVDGQPWNQAHLALANGMAAAALGKPDRESLDEAIELFERLGAPLFVELARSARAGTAANSAPAKQLFLNTTRREREIASLVAQGLTNRQIAETLVLSERTVEGHIANLFAKVNVNSRTQLAAWYLRLSSSVA